MIQIEFTPTFKRIRDFADKHNREFRCIKESNYSGTNAHKRIELDPDAPKKKIDDHAQMIRSCHIELFDELVRFMAAQLSVKQRITPLSYDPQRDDLDYLSTNNVALATAMRRSPRTISRQLKRLQAAGFILHRRFKGSVNNYELKLKTSLLYLIKDGNPILIPDNLRPSNNSLNPRNPRNYQVNCGNSEEFRGISRNTHRIGELMGIDKTEFPDKEESKKLKENIIDLSGGYLDKSSISGLLDIFKGNMSKLESQSAKPDSNSASQRKGPAPQLKKTPPIARAPLTVNNSLETPKEVSLEVAKYGQLLMNFMFASIFVKLDFHSPSQEKAAKKFIIDQIGHLEGRELKAKFMQLRIRMQLAKDWVDRGHEVQLKDENGSLLFDEKGNPITKWSRFIVVPSMYFDPNYPQGFARTKIWYEQMKDNARKTQAANERSAHIMEMFTALNKAVSNYMKNDNVETYKRERRKLEKQWPEAGSAFNEMVLISNKKFVA